MAKSIIDDLLTSADFTGNFDSKIWGPVKRSFPGASFDQFIDVMERLAAARLEGGALAGFAVAAAAVAQSHGVEFALGIADAGLAISKAAGGQAAAAMFSALPDVAMALHDHTTLKAWLRTVEEVAGLAPESVSLVLQHSPRILAMLSVLELRAWTLNGIRQAGGDPAKRLAYFGQVDQTTLLAFQRNPDDVTFADRERQLRAFLMALWRLRPAIRTAMVRPGGRAPRRSSFDGAFIRLPEIYSGYRGAEAAAHYTAVMAHIGAHMAYGRGKFPVGKLKPIQIALVGLIEDARVEALALRDYPGLKRLWQRFHVARPGVGFSAELLMARLARSLLDSSYVDDDPWVNKGRMLFHDNRSQWDDPIISRKIGDLLGNDLGQMRVQFNSRTHVIEPSYRDDNTGLWDYGDAPPEQAETAELLLEAVRITQTDEKEKPDRREHGEGADSPANMAVKLQATPDDQGIPIARHAEWDHIAGVMRNEWTTIVEFQAKPASPDDIEVILRKYADVENRIARLVRSAKVSRRQRMRRQPQGDRIDLDACIRAAIEHRAGLTPDPRLYETSEMRARDLSVLLLLDVSESTRDRVRDTTTTVIAMERAAAALVGQAMSGLGDPFAIHAFCSDGREEVRYYRVKDFGESFGEATRARLAGLRGRLSTRLGAALRQAAAEISSQATHRKLILVVTDGEPSDVDVVDRVYLAEDSRKAVQHLSHLGVDVFCVGLDSGGESYLPRIFGRRNFLVINRLESLPEKLPMLYFRLTR
ncbi:MAG: VWA domain-containing protein [Alphaproteobacteria bacterium]|nr:VWA domain-containing protein [Alphaproteobacteria bacterium]